MLSIRSPPWVTGGRGKGGLEVFPEASCQSVPGRSHWDHSGAPTLGKLGMGAAEGRALQPQGHTPGSGNPHTSCLILASEG